MSKIDHPVIPETMGLIPAITYLFLMFTFIPFMFLKYGVDNGTETHNSNGFKGLFPNSKLSTYLSCLLSLESMILLGLLDDLFDIRWRHKFFLPSIACIPMLIVYYIHFNKTSVLIPRFVAKRLPDYIISGNSIDLGWLYYVYMGSVSIFCPNSVNILAGINGLEVGQTIVITVLLLMNDLYYLAVGAGGNADAYSIHMFSVCFLIPFLGISTSLLQYNWFPSRVFVGDTWCYFSGMVFAVVGISGHFAKTLMLFFIPQIFNFIYSAPQLFGIIACPRHRLPKFNKEDGLLYNSYTEYEGEGNKPLNLKLYPIMNLLEKLKLISLVKKQKGDKEIIIKSSNLTLINLTIIWTGPIREDKLCLTIMIMQFAVGLTMLILRHSLAPMLFGFDNSWTMLNRFY
ncbi:unnamed protein product [Ambrosiozyma monospora]|uniref:Unnamed protein product n=1 Tax=Ambrosiozyma monospora TaxID=43982 RepID=A0ACB5T6P9_AMBMO|nr:unnamed protein product [Ambrosiozyma monospora]